MFFSKKKKKNKIDILFYFQKSLKFLDEKIDPRNLPEFYEYRYLGKINFRSPILENMKRIIPLETLKKDRSYSNGDYIWEAEYEEYLRVYKKNEISEAIKKHLNPALHLLKENIDNVFYQYMVSKYELSIITVYETLKESIEYNGDIPKELKKETVNILVKFSTSIQKCESEKKNYKERDKFSFNTSLIERLKLENEFIKKHIE